MIFHCVWFASLYSRTHWWHNIHMKTDCLEVIKKKLIEHEFVKDEHLRQILQMHHCKANETTVFFIAMWLITIVAITLSLYFYDFCIRKLQQSHLRKQSTLIHLSQSRTECTSLWRSGLCWQTSRRVSGLFRYVYKFVDDDKAHNQIYIFPISVINFYYLIILVLIISLQKQCMTALLIYALPLLKLSSTMPCSLKNTTTLRKALK